MKQLISAQLAGVPYHQRHCVDAQGLGAHEARSKRTFAPCFHKEMNDDIFDDVCVNWCTIGKMAVIFTYFIL